MISEKTGLSEEMAKTAVEMVIGYLKDHLPAPIAGQLDSVLGGADITKDVGGLLQGLGGLLGKK